MRRLRFSFPLCLLTLFAATYLWGQVATTSLHGTVSDERGGLVNGATVTITDPATGFTRSTKTAGKGEYEFPQIPPATYELTTSAAGFATMKQTDIQLLVNTPGQVKVTMKVSAQVVVVEVTGAQPMVNTDNATLGQAFNRDQIASLPFEGRDPTGILSLQPGVVFTGNSSHINSAADSRSGSVNGARSDQTNVTLDGVDNNDQLLGLAFQGAVRVPLDSLEEFKVTTSNSDADTGRSSGGQVSLVTKTGTNRIHGGVYEYYRPTFTTANDWFNRAAEISSGKPNIPPFLLRNTFGAYVGGPIKKDRLFYFFDYEGQRKREDLQVTRIVPSDTLRQGEMVYPCTGSSGCPASGVETLTAANLASLDPGCNCPLGPGPDPAVMAVFQQYPHPNTDSVGDGFDFRGFTFASPLPAKLDAYVGKIDYYLTPNGNHRLFLRGALDNDREALRSNPDSFTGDGGSMFPGQAAARTQHNNSKSLSAGYTATFSPTLLNNFRFGYIRQGLDVSGLQNQAFIRFRGMDDLTAETPTTNTNVPVKNVVDDITKISGNHTLQFGVNFRQVDNIRQSNSTSFFFGETNAFWLAGSCISNCGVNLDPATGPFPAVVGSFGASYDFAVSALAGLVEQVNSNYNLTKALATLPQGAFVPRHFRTHEWEWYGQDQWRLKPNLTFTYGLRYTLLQPPYETTGTQVAPTMSLNSYYKQRGASMLRGQVYDPVIQFALSGQANGGKPYWAWDYKDVAPRVAFAFSPNGDSGWSKKLWGGPGKTSIRAGYGIYYDHFGEGITNTFDRNGSFGLTTSITNAAGVQTVAGSARLASLHAIPTTSQSPTGTCSANCPIVEPPPTGSFPVTPPLGVNNGGFAITWGLDDRLKTPYAHGVDFSLTRELPSHFVFEASYVGRFAHRLLQEEDVAEPVNLVDAATGVSYFQAAQALARVYTSKNAPTTTAVTPAIVGPTASYWQDLFPGAAGGPGNVGGEFGIAGTACDGSTVTGNVTALQAMYDLFCENSGNETTALEYADVPGVVTSSCYPACATINGVQSQGFDYYSPQYSSLFAWKSIGNSSYNAGQFSLRHRSGGLEFDLNYTYSRSIDVGSNAERINEFEGFGFASQVINSWFPKQLRAVSDYDAAHQINANWVYQLPVGRGKQFGSGMGRLANAVVGGWTVSGVWRWSTGYPLSFFSPFWATNFQLQTPAVLSGHRPEVGSFIVPEASGGTGPNLFKDSGIVDPTNPNAAINQFRAAFPGEAGNRNILRGPGTFNFDTGLSKSWAVTERQAVKLTWEVFNVFNTPRFDVGTLELNGNNFLNSSTSFGNYSSTLSNPRVMEFALRYTF